jgi:hypothetical protein
MKTPRKLRQCATCGFTSHAQTANVRGKVIRRHCKRLGHAEARDG